MVDLVTLKNIQVFLNVGKFTLTAGESMELVKCIEAVAVAIRKLEEPPSAETEGIKSGL